MPIDRVVPIKQERPDLGGTESDDIDTPADPNEDALDARGLYIQNDSSDDTSVLITRTSDNKLSFTDPTGTKKLDEIATTTASEASHKTLRQLIHLAEEGGPWEGFASGAYQEVLPAADPFPTSIIWWTSSAKTAKIVEETISYNGNKTINTDQWKVYDTDGSTVLATVTDTYAYSGVFVTSRTRVIS
jgi:hypothetical protein